MLISCSDRLLPPLFVFPSFIKKLPSRARVPFWLDEIMRVARRVDRYKEQEIYGAG